MRVPELFVGGQGVVTSFVHRFEYFLIIVLVCNWPSPTSDSLFEVNPAYGGRGCWRDMLV